MMLMYMAVVIYAPAIAFSQVTGLSTFITIIGVGVICTFYTAVGGMKAVIYTDSFQMIIILVCLIVLCIMGAVNIGDTSAMWDIISEGGRLEFDNFSVDPTTRHSFWTQSFGGCFITLNILGTNQAMIQRFLSIKTTKDAQRAVFYALFAIVLFIAITTSLGLIIYAYYADCDPLKAGQIETRDQLVPLFTMHIMGNLHGLPGIFTAAVFSGTLSAVSSGVNALAAVILTDMIRPAYLYKTGQQLSGQISTNLSKIVSMFLGLTAIGLAYIAPLLGDTLLQVSLSLFGMVGGPLLGLFSLALLFPCVNQWGALVGFLSSIAVTFWLSIGAIVNPTIPVSLPRVTTGCPVLTPDVSNITTLDYTSLPSLLDPTTDTPHQDSGSSIDDLYKLSYMWYGVLSAFVAIVVGLLVSFCTGCSSHEEVEPVLLFSYYTRCGVCFGPCGCHRCCNEIHEDHMEGSLDVKPQPTIDREDTNGHVLPEKHTQAGEHTNGIKFGSNRKSGKTNQGFVPESNSAQLVGVTRL